MIPYRSTVSGAKAQWMLKADEAPSMTRVILDSGEKVLLAKVDSPDDRVQRKLAKQKETLEENKTRRREQIL